MKCQLFAFICILPSKKSQLFAFICILPSKKSQLFAFICILPSKKSKLFAFICILPSKKSQLFAFICILPSKSNVPRVLKASTVLVTSDESNKLCEEATKESIHEEKNRRPKIWQTYCVHREYLATTVVPLIRHLSKADTSKADTSLKQTPL